MRKPKKIPYLIFQHAPSETIVDVSPSTRLVSLKARVWLDIFDRAMVVGDIVKFGEAEFVIDWMSSPSVVKSLDRALADFTISRTIGISEHIRNMAESIEAYKQSKIKVKKPRIKQKFIRKYKPKANLESVEDNTSYIDFLSL